MGRIVHRIVEGSWGNTPIGEEVPTSIHASRKEARDIACKMLKEGGGGVLFIKGLDGVLRAEITVSASERPSELRPSDLDRRGKKRTGLGVDREQ